MSPKYVARRRRVAAAAGALVFSILASPLWAPKAGLAIGEITDAFTVDDQTYSVVVDGDPSPTVDLQNALAELIDGDDPAAAEAAGLVNVAQAAIRVGNAVAFATGASDDYSLPLGGHNTVVVFESDGDVVGVYPEENNQLNF